MQFRVATTISSFVCMQLYDFKSSNLRLIFKQLYLTPGCDPAIVSRLEPKNFSQNSFFIVSIFVVSLHLFLG